MAVADFGADRGLALPAAAVAGLLASAPPPLDFLTAPARRADAGEAQFEGRAASMLSLVQRGKFHNQNDSHVTERDAKKVTDLLHTKEAGGLDDLLRWPEDTEQPARDKGELLHWSQRLVQLRRKADLPLKMGMRWASKAMEAPPRAGSLAAVPEACAPADREV